MDQVNSALQIVGRWLAELLGVFAGVFGVIEVALHRFMNSIGVPANLQTVIVIIIAVLFIVAVLRLFGGVLRLLIAVLLILFLIHLIAPNLGG